MKVLTAAEMREVDRRTIELGIPGIVLMENAGIRVVEFLAERFAPLGRAAHRGAVRQGQQRRRRPGGRAAAVHALSARRRSTWCCWPAPEELKGDAAANYRMLEACGCPVLRAMTPRTRPWPRWWWTRCWARASAARPAGAMLEGIRAINTAFPLAKVVAVDIPSGHAQRFGRAAGRIRARRCTVTFTAPKLAQVLPPNCDRVGELHRGRHRQPAETLYARTHLAVAGWSRRMFRALAGAAAARRPQGHLRPRAGGGGLARQDRRGGHGAAWPRCAPGAGLVTVASAASAIAADRRRTRRS